MKRVFLASAFVLATGTAQADVGAFVGITYAFGSNQGIGFTVQATSTRKQDRGILAAGLSYHPFATGSKVGAPEGQDKAWKKHAQQWFKSTDGGKELAQKMVALGAWAEVQPQLLPLVNAVLAAVGRPALQKLDL